MLNQEANSSTNHQDHGDEHERLPPSELSFTTIQ